ncbi:tRNA threonylcarbamoyladenosine biosynthesis protein TsaB [Desulfocicer vacuolatum DSM 3385]|uniref:tRNA threonylcarbamoyladenosine biosynthesis protein TsaB n=1 Tax=Desulfocicer vacuolatum DSM 3385 TaxID=1121400 RepID=A0A1W1ZCR3_9BACT|nr:tRNA (adenosine(37)-N6)-threonylcarbamoyltransferase complex dimerization subunit type 1 TsaB [Desulfocicer vacuolatum]SMC46225.1 tRNA threonylcarbamoyladenosine biosynthesis protein TsaB [Desulfocicer vacuolatum DSM 3385]
MKILAVDTAEQGCSIALVNDGVPVCERYGSGLKNHAVTLLPLVEKMLVEDAGVCLDGLDGFVVSRGPGSFTGLRIGLSMVKGLALATGKPVAGISSLDGIAWRMSHAALPVCAMLDARRGEVYCALYQFENGVLMSKGEEMVVSPETALAMVGKRALFVGSGAAAHARYIIRELGPDAVFAPAFQNHVSAPALAHVFFQDPHGYLKDPAALVPVYLRRSDAEINYSKAR